MRYFFSSFSAATTSSSVAGGGGTGAFGSAGFFARSVSLLIGFTTQKKTTAAFAVKVMTAEMIEPIPNPKGAHALR